MEFSVTQILREINFGELRNSKIVVFFVILGALTFVILVKVQKLKNENSVPLS